MKLSKFLFQSFSKTSLLPAIADPQEFNLLSKKIKSLERSCENILDPHLPFVIRLDGCSFKRYTDGLQKPFDQRITDSLIHTMEVIVEKTGASIGFCQSDEISAVVLAAQSSNENTPQSMDLQQAKYIYGGRVQKITSIIASIASNAFNNAMQSYKWDDICFVDHSITQKAKERVSSGNAAYFDCRVFSVPDVKTATEAIYWRHNYDCRRNAINMVGNAHFSHKQMHRLSLQEVATKLFIEKGVDILKEFSPSNIYGAFCKKIIVPHTGYNPHTNNTVETIRQRTLTRSMLMSDLDTEQDRIRFVIAKTWNEFDEIANKNENEN